MVLSSYLPTAGGLRAAFIGHTAEMKKKLPHAAAAVRRKRLKRYRPLWLLAIMQAADQPSAKMPPAFEAWRLPAAYGYSEAKP